MKNAKQTVELKNGDQTEDQQNSLSDKGNEVEVNQALVGATQRIVRRKSKIGYWDVDVQYTDIPQYDKIVYLDAYYRA